VSRFSRYGAALAGILLSAPGCYRYTPVPFETVPPGDNVRVYVSRAAMVDLEEALTESGPVLSGIVARRDNDLLFLRVPVGSRQVGFHSESIDQEVPIPLREITQVERREFNRMGTGALVAGTIGAAAVVVFLIMEAYGDPGFENGCADCVDMRLPFLSVPLR
jgi:hypothetical protein